MVIDSLDDLADFSILELVLASHCFLNLSLGMFIHSAHRFLTHHLVYVNDDSLSSGHSVPFDMTNLLFTHGNNFADSNHTDSADHYWVGCSSGRNWEAHLLLGCFRGGCLFDCSSFYRFYVLTHDFSHVGVGFEADFINPFLMFEIRNSIYNIIMLY